MISKINSYFNNIPKLLLKELQNNDFPFGTLNKDELKAGIISLSSIICNKLITGKCTSRIQIPNIQKKETRNIVKLFLQYINGKFIQNLINDNILPSERVYHPIETIDLFDIDNTIRAVNLNDKILNFIWNKITQTQRKNNRMRRYFKYGYDNPPLTEILPFLKEINERKNIRFIKGHGMSPIIRIPEKINSDFAFLLGAIRDGGIHYDMNNNAYKIHFEEQNKQYLKQEIQSRLKKVFGLETHITLRPDGVHQIQFASKPIYLLLAKCFGMREIQQFWNTPILIKNAPLSLQKAYIRGFFDAEGTFEHLYHSWFSNTECPPLQFISDVLNFKLDIRCTSPQLVKINNEFNRFPVFQLYIHDYPRFIREILTHSMYWH
jgi:hypothetical protein